MGIGMPRMMEANKHMHSLNFTLKLNVTYF